MENLLTNIRVLRVMEDVFFVSVSFAFQVDPLCRYDDLVYVAGFDFKFCLAGGVNLPKIIFCVGSDGVKRRQLVKV